VEDVDDHGDTLKIVKTGLDKFAGQVEDLTVGHK
jgi:hypothetical protein